MRVIENGLRERKKRRTRASLVEAAADLCLRNGYDATTVEQIAALADVSPRTFSRYFPTKESVITAMTGDMDGFIAEALREQPTDISEYEALLRARLQVFGPDEERPTPGFRRMAVLIQIINKSESLRSTAFLHQREIEEREAFTVIGERIGLPATDSAVRMIADTWTIVFANAYAGLGTPGHDPLEPRILCDRIAAQYELFRRSWSPWISDRATSGQPHVSALGE
jgi:AcrR family transcriptional regulator